MKLLGEGADSLCAVGDEDQAIYRWRGAEVEHILRFDEDFPGARIVPLERNYRSTAGILDAASGARREQPAEAQEAARRRPRRPARGSDCGGSTRIAPRRKRSRGRSPRRSEPGEVAILYRTNAQSRPFEEELVRRRIPYVVVGGMKFYERAEVKDALAYLRLAGRPDDDLAFRRVVNVPARGIGQTTLDQPREGGEGDAVRRGGWCRAIRPPA